MPKDKLVKVNKHGKGMARVKPVKHHGDGVSSFTVKNPDKSTYTFRSKDTNFEDANYNPKPLKPKKTKKMKKQRIPRKLKNIKAPDFNQPEVKITAADRKILSDKSEADKRNKKLARKRKINKLKKNLRAAFTKVRTGVRPKFTAGGPFMVKEDQAYYYKVDGKTVTKAEYTAAHKKGVATPGNKNFTDGKGLQTNDPDAFGYKADTEKARQNNKASKRATVLTKNQTKLNEKTIPFKKTSKFKAHMMYKDGKAVRANTYAKHLELKRKGYTHSK